MWVVLLRNCQTTRRTSSGDAQRTNLLISAKQLETPSRRSNPGSVAERTFFTRAHAFMISMSATPGGFIRTGGAAALALALAWALALVLVLVLSALGSLVFLDAFLAGVASASTAGGGGGGNGNGGPSVGGG